MPQYFALILSFCPNKQKNPSFWLDGLNMKGDILRENSGSADRKLITRNRKQSTGAQPIEQGLSRQKTGAEPK